MRCCSYPRCAAAQHVVPAAQLGLSAAVGYPVHGMVMVVVHKRAAAAVRIEQMMILRAATVLQYELANRNPPERAQRKDSQCLDPHIAAKARLWVVSKRTRWGACERISVYEGATRRAKNAACG